MGREAQPRDDQGTARDLLREMENADRPSTELLDKYFDFFKHVGTLNAAVAVVLLAITRDEGLGPSVYLALGFFGVSLIVALLGMDDVLRALRFPTTSSGAGLRKKSLVSGGMFLGGLAGFAWAALIASRSGGSVSSIHRTGANFAFIWFLEVCCIAPAHYSMGGAHG